MRNKINRIDFRGFAYWEKDFSQQSPNLDTLNWSLSDLLKDSQRELIAVSVADFQIGEYSEGRNLMNKARALAEELEQPELIAITKRFIKEEQFHSKLLLCYMRRNGIPVKGKSWTDVVFRGLRKHVDFELSLLVLTTAELVSLTYYKALMAATDSHLLRTICTRILRDERRHLDYESTLIYYLNQQSKPWLKFAKRSFHFSVYFGALCAVWISHRRVLKSGGYGLLGFFRQSILKYNAYFGKWNPVVRRSSLTRLPSRVLAEERLEYV